jgi:hypothetical protein
MHWQDNSADSEPASTSPADKPPTPRGSGWLDRRGLLRRLLEPTPQPTLTRPQPPQAKGSVGKNKA